MSLQTKNNPTHHVLFWYLANFRLQSKLILSASLKYYPVDGKFFTLNSVCSTAAKICTDELKWM